MLKLRFVFPAALLLAIGALPAQACRDQTEQVIKKLKKIDVTMNQMKDVFELQKKQRGEITKAHTEGLGCKYHEDKEVDFEKAAFGVLDDAQFEKLMGRERNEIERLRHDNYTLVKEIEKLKAELEALRAAKK
jgi:hypothetical protein